MLDEKRAIAKIIPRLARVLIVDPQPQAARLLSELLRDLARSQTVSASSTVRAYELAKDFNPQIIFVESAGPELDGCKLVRAIRRSELACREAPVVMVTSTATAASIMAARDAGVHEFLRKPFTTKDLVRRLLAVTLQERMWIEAMNYIGPDRRRFNSAEYAGPRKRRSDPRELSEPAKIRQALAILKSAVEATGRDPVQALRSMQAQGVELHRAATAVNDIALSLAAKGFQDYLAAMAGQPLNPAAIAPRAAPLLAFEPTYATAA